MAAGDASASTLFVICHGNSSSDDQELPGKEPLARSPCILCTLAKAPCAILPTDHGIAVNDAMGTCCCANRRPRSRLQFAHGPVSAWPAGEHFHSRLIRSPPSAIG